MTRIKELNRLLSLIVHMLTKEVRLTHAGVFLWDAENENYALKSSRDHHELPIGMRVSKDDALMAYLKQERDAIVFEEQNAQLAGMTGNERASPKLPPPTILETMKRIGGAVVVPSFAEDKLLGFFVLGEKKSGQIFSPDDLAVFVTLANQAAIAIENAMYFEELKTNEAFLIQSEKLATMGQLASGMAHEIHNPLTIISGESQLMLDRLKKTPPILETTEERAKFVEEVKTQLQSAVEEVARASDITRRILKFSRVSKEGFIGIDVNQLLQDTLTLAGYQHNMKMFEVVTEIPEGLPHVHGNVNQLQEVFLNLTVNACQAMGNKGKFTIAAREVPVDHHHMVEITVTDTGPGVQPGKLSKIFDPFYTTKSNGTGLGLFVTQRIVKGHGGTITATSTVGTGTTFTVQLPIFKAQFVKNN